MAKRKGRPYAATSVPITLSELSALVDILRTAGVEPWDQVDIKVTAESVAVIANGKKGHVQ
jgi:hypothetical protein